MKASRAARVGLVGLGLALAAVAGAATVTITTVKDNTLYESATGSLSNGAGAHFFAGKTAGGAIRRGAIAFDVAAIPAGSTITNVVLTLRVSRTKNDAGQTVQLRRLLANWGEGASVASGQEGAGAPSAPGDATWKHRFYDTTLWTSAGGDFSATVSGSTSVGGNGSYAWTSPQMIADVQAWLDNPSTNFGWIVIGNESQV